MMEPRDPPSFRSLLIANLRVVGWALGLMLVAYALWRGLAELFPDDGSF